MKKPRVRFLLVAVFLVLLFMNSQSSSSIQLFFNLDDALQSVESPFSVGNIICSDKIDASNTIVIYQNEENPVLLQAAIIQQNWIFYQVVRTSGSIPLSGVADTNGEKEWGNVLISWYDEASKYIVLAVAYDEDVQAITMRNSSDDVAVAMTAIPSETHSVFWITGDNTDDFLFDLYNADGVLINTITSA